MHRIDNLKLDLKPYWQLAPLAQKKSLSHRKLNPTRNQAKAHLGSTCSPKVSDEGKESIWGGRLWLSTQYPFLFSPSVRQWALRPTGRLHLPASLADGSGWGHTKRSQWAEPLEEASFVQHLPFSFLLSESWRDVCKCSIHL